MRPLDIKDIRKRGMARERRRFVLLRALLFPAVCVAVVGGLAYLLLFSGAFAIRDITLNGLETASPAAVRGELDAMMARPFAGFLKPFRSVLFFKVSSAEAALREKFPVMKSVAGKKDFFHALAFDFVERKPMGVWCFPDGCQYFDEEGTAWGLALRSSGFLLLTVVDNRAAPASIDPLLLAAVKSAVAGMQSMPMAIRQITIPAGSVTELHVITERGYPVKIAADSDIPGQFKAFTIFLGQKKLDASFHPEYVDLRINGRIYYKMPSAPPSEEHHQ